MVKTLPTKYVALVMSVHNQFSSSSMHVAAYGFLWTTYHNPVRKCLEGRSAKKCREKIPGDLSIPGGKFSSSTKAYQSRYIFVILDVVTIYYQVTMTAAILY